MADYVYGGFPEEVELLVGQCLGRGYNYAFPSVDTERIEILHIADSDAVVIAISHHFILDFLPSAQRFFHEHLRRERESLGGNDAQFLLVLAEA